jgi:replicative DNA helicase
LEHVSLPLGPAQLEVRQNAERTLVASMFDAPIGSSSELSISTKQLNDASLQLIARSAAALRKEGSPVDLVTVCDFLSRHELLQQVGGMAEISELANHWCPASSLPSRREIVLSDWRRRERVRIARELTDGKLQDGPAADELRSLGSGGKKREPQHISESLAELFLSGPSPHVPLGLSGLSGLMVEAGHLCTVGARPGVGKSALLTSIALSTVRHNWNTLFISLEMPGREIRRRLAAGYSGLPLATVHLARDAAGSDADRLLATSNAMSEMPLWMDADHKFSDHLRIDHLASLIEQFAQAAGDAPCVVLLDYLQLVRPSGRYQNRVEAVGEVCRELKATALRASVPIICAAQLSRAVEQRGSNNSAGKPRMSDLRESGEIEQVSDQVILLHRENSEAWLNVAKNRHGPCFTAGAEYTGPSCLFTDGGAW